MFFKKYIKLKLILFVLLILVNSAGLSWRYGQEFNFFNVANASDVKPGYTRIISMAPNITETVFALGHEKYLIAITDFCKFPPQTKELQKVGGFFNPNLERIAVLKPDLIILQGKHEKVAKFCRHRGISIMHVNMDSLDSIYNGILELGKVFGCIDRAKKLCANIRSELEQTRKKVSAHTRKKVFLCLGRSQGSMTGIYSAGGKSFLSELVTVAGGDNIFSDVKHPYPEISKESLMKRGPDIIIETRPG